MFFELREGTSQAPQRSERQIAAAYRKLFVTASQCKSARLLLDASLNLMAALFGVSSCAACVLKGQKLHFIAARGEVVHLLESEFCLSQELLEQRLLLGTGCILKRHEVSTGFLEHTRNAEFMETMLAPMILDGRPHGLLGVGSKVENYFCNADLMCMCDIAEFVAMLLEQQQSDQQAQELRHFEQTRKLCAHFSSAVAQPIQTLAHCLEASMASGPSAPSREYAQKCREPLGALQASCQDLEALEQICESVDGARELLYIPTLLEEILLDLRHELESCASLTSSFEDKVPQVLAHKQGLRQALRALMLNAAQAIEMADSSENHAIHIQVYAQPRQVIVEITDTGCGICASDLHRVFDPFFSTWPQHKGLGLSQALHLTLHLGGTLALQNLPMRGSCARLQLPYANHHKQESVF